MNKIVLSFIVALALAAGSAGAGIPLQDLPQPEVERRNFLLTNITEEMNVDFAIFWTDSAASLFICPFDALILHVDIDGEMHDVFVISDMAMSRLTAWVCTQQDTSGYRHLRAIKAYYGDEVDTLRTPSGLAVDDHGRIYIANQAAGMIQMYGPNLKKLFEFYGTLGLEPGQLYFPNNIIIDTYYDTGEALILELYSRQSGIQTYEIPQAWYHDKPPLGFDGTGLPKIAMDPASSPIPLRYSLADAYPNPFNSACIISFFIWEDTEVKIEVFNVLGQKVATVLHETRRAGEHSVIFDADDIASGVYFYKMSAGEFTRTKSMVLLK
jgi:hypothetical protein